MAVATHLENRYIKRLLRAYGIHTKSWDIECRDFWIRETGTGQQVAQLHDRYMMMMMMMMMIYNVFVIMWHLAIR